MRAETYSNDAPKIVDLYLGGPSTLSTCRRSINRMTDSRSRLGIRSAHPTDCARALQARVGLSSRRGGRFLRFRISNRSAFHSQSAVLTSRGRHGIGGAFPKGVEPSVAVERDFKRLLSTEARADRRLAEV